MAGWKKSPPELVALFDEIVPNDPAIERRTMFGYPAAFLSGRMFAGLYQETVVMKLDEKNRALMARDFGARTFEPIPGRKMGEFMEAPTAILGDRDTLRRWIGRAAAYVASLPAKDAKPKRARAAKTKARTGK
jgi:TfoX/Sxy family transcriptional regulator of competence genes